MRFSLIVAAVAALTATSAMADAPRPGQVIRDSGNARVGNVDRVNADGSVRLIYDSRFVTIPADKLEVKDNAVLVSLKKNEIAKIR